jgi:hypothetical protein
MTGEIKDLWIASLLFGYSFFVKCLFKQFAYFSIILSFFFFFNVLWYWALNCSYTLSHSISPIFFFCDGFFEIESCELFIWSGFELSFSWSLPPNYLGLQAWATSAWLDYPFLIVLYAFLMYFGNESLDRYGYCMKHISSSTLAVFSSVFLTQVHLCHLLN